MPTLHNSVSDPLGLRTVDAEFDRLEHKINAKFDQLQAETTAKFRFLARSVGQRTRSDRMKAHG